MSQIGAPIHRSISHDEGSLWPWAFDGSQGRTTTNLTWLSSWLPMQNGLERAAELSVRGPVKVLPALQSASQYVKMSAGKIQADIGCGGGRYATYSGTCRLQLSGLSTKS